MKAKLNCELCKELNKITPHNRKLEILGFLAVDSEEFNNVQYGLKDNTVLISATRNGQISFDLDSADRFIEETKQVIEHFKEAKNKNLSIADCERFITSAKDMS